MVLKFNLQNILILFGILQGLLLVLLINFSQPSKAKRFLSLLLLAFSLNTLRMILYDIGLFEPYPILNFYPFFFYLIGPALYLYCSHLIGIKQQSYLLHLIPFFLNTGYYLAGLIFISPDLLTFHQETYRYFEELFSLISVGAYLFITLKLVANYNLWRLNQFTDSSTQTINWLRNLIIAYAGGWLFWLVYFILDISQNYFYSFDGAEAYYPLYIYMSIFIYWIGYAGYKHQDFAVIATINNHKRIHAELSSAEQEQLDHIIQKIKQEKLFTIISLKLVDLANQFEMKTHTISYLINQGLNKNFYDFINELRIDEFKQKLSNKALNHYTIQSLAEESGFKARSTYNDLFKKALQLTPNEYKLQQQKD